MAVRGLDRFEEALLDQLLEQLRQADLGEGQASAQAVRVDLAVDHAEDPAGAPLDFVPKPYA